MEAFAAFPTDYNPLDTAPPSLSRKELSKLRKELAAARPKPAKPVALQKGLSSGTPSRKGILGGLVNRANDQGGVYLLPFFFADPAGRSNLILCITACRLLPNLLHLTKLSRIQLCA